MQTQNDRMLSVTQVNEYIKAMLDNSPVLSRVHVLGEISNFKHHLPSGHFYFTLKDENSVLKAVMFRSSAERMRFMPENSMQVIVSGRISVYPRDGQYQIYADSMEPLGLGALYVAFEQMRLRLEAKGYFDAAHKKPIPDFPQKIGIITSPTGAAVADMKDILTRRYPLAQIEIFPSLVQGEGAPEDLCRGLAYFDADDSCDVIIIGRGGGSMEDLWAFNDERVATAVYHTNTPVISAVGHETDFTICDFVADLRAPTPSAAAELAVPDKKDLAAHLIHQGSRIQQAFSGLISGKRTILESFAAKKCFTSPNYLTDRRNEEIALLDRRIAVSFDHIFAGKKNDIAAVSSRLAALNPMNVLARGYAALLDDKGRVVDSVKKTQPGDALALMLADGEIRASVNDIIPKT